MPQDVNAVQLNTQIKAANAAWMAGTPSVSELSTSEQLSHLGYVPTDGEESLEQRTAVSSAMIGVIAPGLPLPLQP